MTANKAMPRAENIPPLGINIEGLKRHSFLCIFIAEPSLSVEQRKLRSWLLHTVTTATRHYSKARELVVSQGATDQTKDGGVIFHVLDVSEQIEGCVTAIFRACNAIRRMAGEAEGASRFVASFESQMKDLSSVRNQFEHMHSQIASGETGTGPISMAFGDEGDCIRFRRLQIKTTDLHNLIEGAFEVVAGMFPAFDAKSAPEAGGPVKLTMTATVVESRPQNGDSGDTAGAAQQ